MSHNFRPAHTCANCNNVEVVGIDKYEIKYKCTVTENPTNGLCVCDKWGEYRGGRHGKVTDDE